jgi:hypothetical protein
MNPFVHMDHAKVLWPILHRPGELLINSAQWRINGFPATIIIWTEEEWERLVERPPDAQYFPCGVWCALRME